LFSKLVVRDRILLKLCSHQETAIHTDNNCPICKAALTAHPILKDSHDSCPACKIQVARTDAPLADPPAGVALSTQRPTHELEWTLRSTRADKGLALSEIYGFGYLVFINLEYISLSNPLSNIAALFLVLCFSAGILYATLALLSSLNPQLQRIFRRGTLRVSDGVITYRPPLLVSPWQWYSGPLQFDTVGTTAVYRNWLPYQGQTGNHISPNKVVVHSNSTPHGVKLAFGRPEDADYVERWLRQAIAAA